MKKILILIGLVLFIIGCGSGGNVPGIDNNSSTSSTSSNSSSSTPSYSGRLTWMDKNLGTYMALSEEYAQPYDTSVCESGLLSTSYSDKMLELVNEIRKLHNLNPLTYSYEAEKSMQDASLMMDVNNKLDHHPPEDWKCYSTSGAAGAGNSNLGLGYYTLGQTIVRGWLQDGGVSSLGHRRWMLSPGMSNTAFGAVGRGYAMKTMGYGSNKDPEFIAYPYLDYPYALLGAATWSFCANDGSTYHSSVSFDSAKVTISDIGNVPFTVLGSNYGAGTTISFTPKGWEPNKTYTVRVSGIKNAVHDTYTYKVKIIK